MVGGLAGWLAGKIMRAATEPRRYDHRALCEGVRVQIYWNAAGIGRSAAAHYMQRQRDEMDWIRSALASLAFPYQRWADTFHRRAPGEQRRALSAVTKIWVREQWHYYGNQGRRYGARPDTSPSEPGSA